MDDEFLKKRARQVRELAEKADIFTRRRLIILADDYERQLKKPTGSIPPTMFDKKASSFSGSD
ncbi:MAG TPA: hypothetical protein VHI52_09040 [Verrucomicrobiae bacterium]|nr:hypothetical protein [Verrucomicrobiae bacterium]HVX77633.1 hypothetical protein [Bradyrhizobium sp.]